MLRIKNLTNSPYDIMDAKGKKVHLPARGEIETSVHAQHLPLYRAIGYFKITELSENPKAPEEAKKAPEEAKKAPSKVADKEAISKLRDEYEKALGKKPFAGWKEDELRKRIDEALAG